MTRISPLVSFFSALSLVAPRVVDLLPARQDVALLARLNQQLNTQVPIPFLPSPPLSYDSSSLLIFAYIVMQSSKITLFLRELFCVELKKILRSLCFAVAAHVGSGYTPRDLDLQKRRMKATTHWPLK